MLAKIRRMLTRKHCPITRAKHQQLSLEILEERAVPAAYVFTDGMGDHMWQTKGNWSTANADGQPIAQVQNIPTAMDQVYMTQANFNTIIITGNADCAQLTTTAGQADKIGLATMATLTIDGVNAAQGAKSVLAWDTKVGDIATPGGNQNLQGYFNVNGGYLVINCNNFGTLATINGHRRWNPSNANLNYNGPQGKAVFNGGWSGVNAQANLGAQQKINGPMYCQVTNSNSRSRSQQVDYSACPSVLMITRMDKRSANDPDSRSHAPVSGVT